MQCLPAGDALDPQLFELWSIFPNKLSRSVAEIFGVLWQKISITHVVEIF
jgi:hypothetical protein